MGMIPLELRENYMGLRQEAKLCKLTTAQLRHRIKLGLIKVDLTLRDKDGKVANYLFNKPGR